MCYATSNTNGANYIVLVCSFQIITQRNVTYLFDGKHDAIITKIILLKICVRPF